MTNPVIEARDYFNEQADRLGWWKDGVADSGNGVCPVVLDWAGAEHAEIVRLLSRAAVALFPGLCPLPDDPTCSVNLTEVNDNPATTREQIDTLYSHAAVLWEQEHKS